MNYKQAKRKSYLKVIIGFILLLTGLISSIISILKMLYSNISDGSVFGELIGDIFKKLIYLIYTNTKFLNFFWENCPTPNLNILIAKENMYFMFIYLLIFIGLAIYRTGLILATNLRNIDKRLENELIINNIRQKKEEESKINDSSTLSQLHQLYMAPLIVTVIGGILLKLLGF
ncbi:YniB family protein [Aliarcobacter butzleri]|uniref:YniB family protein n=1 Tax=Aliarcobacter butzleri TaxID=28197 RepID=UPI00189CB1A1|nr:YniB family protein [Aliarcobacter butzleri]MBF7071336.1 yfeABCD locus regulator [Aliarcobacter butzleri]MDN5093820.1 hypothetical protein [Aliarcobacter butzleri]